MRSVVPVVGAVAERPALQHPGAPGIVAGQHGRDRLGVRRDLGRVLDRRGALDEGVDGVEAVGPEHRLLGREQRPAELLVGALPRIDGVVGEAHPVHRSGAVAGQLAREVAGEARQHRRHTELSLPVQDAPAELHPAVDLRQLHRRPVVVHAAHPDPGQVRRGAEVATRPLVRHAVVAQDLQPDPLEADGGEWKVHAGHGHPVDLDLPPRPVPVRRGVAERAVVEVVAPPPGAGGSRPSCGEPIAEVPDVARPPPTPRRSPRSRRGRRRPRSRTSSAGGDPTPPRRSPRRRGPAVTRRTRASAALDARASVTPSALPA